MESLAGIAASGCALAAAARPFFDFSRPEGKLALASLAGLTYVRIRSRQQEWPNSEFSPTTRYYVRDVPSRARRRPGFQNFPPPYPNGWVFIGPSTSLPKLKVRPIDVCGKQLVAYRTADGKVGVLVAFCSHMGTHLGHGGYVKDDRLVCPYHQWEFDCDGQLHRIPYSPNEGKADCSRPHNNMKSYPVMERHGMVFVWIHADNEEPFELPILDLVEQKGLRPICRVIADDMKMHCMEPSHNSADWYHFHTVHSAISQHWLSKLVFIKAEHDIAAARSAVSKSLDDDGTPITLKQLLITDQALHQLSFLGGLIKMPERWVRSFSKVHVRWNGPLLICFIIDLPFFRDLVCIFPLTPTEPFNTHAEYWSFAGPRWPWPLAWIMTHFIMNTVEQDRENWEHRTHPPTRNAVKGDYSWAKYDQWLKQFYSPSSISYLDDMAW